VLSAGIAQSDSLDIRKTIIEFELNDISSHQIKAHTRLHVQSRMNNLQQIQFDLQGLIVDSIKQNGNSISYAYSSPALLVSFSTPLNTNDTSIFDFYYHGIPVADPGWGGFMFSGLYAFQMGVGFEAQPHSFGRTWHPCFDNFVERSSYEFFITTADTLTAICNGLLLDSSTNLLNHTRTMHWKLDEEIPSYLATVNIGRYQFLIQSLNTLNGPVPAYITCEAADMPAAMNSFSNLPQSMQMLEQHFGAYMWPRVGYSLVPFSGGAMEHATNISIGKAFINGTLDYETMIAHELSHHWWGDYVTCRTAADMWLNEGFASYCEALHLDYVYGNEAYKNEIRQNHFNVLNRTHILDEGYRPVSGIDSLHTYGSTVYDKGKDVIHTLRSYLGDSAFFLHLKGFLTAYAFKDIESATLENYLSMQSGVNLQPYFNDWIYAPGFTHFSIDSVQKFPSGGMYHVRVFLRQRKHHAPHLYSKVPLELGFYTAQMQRQIFQLLFDGSCMQFDVDLPFDPVMIRIDPDEKISDAVTEDSSMISTIGNRIFPLAKCKVNIKSLVQAGDSSLIHAEHHWVAPDRFRSTSSFPGFTLCTSRYWRITGIHLDNLKGNLVFNYDATSNNQYLDSAWIKNTEDSMRLFYRKDASEEWQFANDSISMGSPVDKKGNLYALEIKEGEYTFGIRQSAFTDTLHTEAGSGCGTVTPVPETEKNELVLYPNPTEHVLYLNISDHRPIRSIKAVYPDGRIDILDVEPNSHTGYIIHCEKLTPGFYLLQVNEKNSVPFLKSR